MSKEEDSDPVAEIIQERDSAKILFASYDKIREINAEEFSRIVPSFGLILYSIGMLMLIILAAAIIAYQAVSDGISFSDVDSGLTGILIGLGILYAIIYQIAKHINILTGDEETVEEADENSIFAIFRTPVLILLGIVFWISALGLRISLIPGISEEYVYSSGVENAIPVLGFLFHVIAMDFIYIGILLIGSGIFVQGIYQYRREEPEN